VSNGHAKVARLFRLAWFLAFTINGYAVCTIDFPHDANPTPITDDDICNFHQVDVAVYRGARPNPSAYPKLAALGIRTIIDLEEPAYTRGEQAALAELNRKLPPAQRIDFVSFPIDDTEINLTGVSEARMRSLFQQMDKARKPIFIHCYHGKDRTGTVVAIYRMARQQIPYDQAYEEALHYKFSWYNLGLRITVSRYKTAKKMKALLSP
jgi:protein tyrosine/serine phosphatase